MVKRIQSYLCYSNPMPMRAIIYNSIRFTLPGFRQRRMTLALSAKMMLMLIMLTGSAMAGVHVGVSPSDIIKGNKPTAVATEQWIEVSNLTHPNAAIVQPGDQLQFTVKVRNNSTAGEAVDFTATTEVTAHTTLVNVFPAQTPALPANAPAGTPLTATRTLAAGASAELLSFDVRVDASGTLAGVAYIVQNCMISVNGGTAFPASATQGGPAPVTGEHAIKLPVNNGKNSVAWLSQVINYKGTAGTIQAGDEITYTIHVRNDGPDVLSNVKVYNFIPSYTNWVSGPTLDADGGVSWEITSIPVGQTATVSFVVRVQTDLTGATAIVNSATVENGNGRVEGTFPPADAAGTAPNTTPTTAPSLTIPITKLTGYRAWKLVTNDSDPNSKLVGPGEELTYSIFVQNTGNTTINLVTIRDACPIGTTFKSAKEGGSFTPDINTVEWYVENIAAGATTSVHFTVTVDQRLEGLKVISNTARVSDALDTTSKFTMGCDPNDPKCDRKVGTDITIAGSRGELFVSTVMTPNGDGKNDYFIVRGVDKFPNSTLFIYNRWGAQVYQSKNYQNNWNGNGLAEGTYYYRFMLNQEGVMKEFKGWVIIIR